MDYLLVNHVPFGLGAAPNRFLVGDMWLEDLRAQARAWAPYGRLTVAVPCVEHLDIEGSGSFNLLEVDLAEEEFHLFPLPAYRSWRTFFQTLPRLKHRLHQICPQASIVQADYGGYPIALGQVVWPIAGKYNVPRIWTFDGADPVPRMEKLVCEETNPAKRLVKHQLTRQFENFCRRAVAEANLVFTHNAAVMQRFQPEWNTHCHSFNRSYVQKSFIIDARQAEWRKQQLLDQSQPLRLVTAGRQIAIKATDHLLHAMAIATQLGANLELDVIGDGDCLSSYQQLVQELGLSDRVHFRGTVPYGEPLFQYLQQAQAIVVTNLTAEISRNVLLGMALGLPVILYSNPGTDALIKQADAGILVESGNIKALAAALYEADQNRKRLAQLVTNGVNLAHHQTLEMTHTRRAQLAAECVRQLSTPSTLVPTV